MSIVSVSGSTGLVSRECTGGQELFSIVIPAHNEAENVEGTVRRVHRVLEETLIDHEIIVVNNHSNDARLVRHPRTS